jgi:hypothetical protein
MYITCKGVGDEGLSGLKGEHDKARIYFGGRELYLGFYVQGVLHVLKILVMGQSWNCFPTLSIPTTDGQNAPLCALAIWAGQKWRQTVLEIKV